MIQEPKLQQAVSNIKKRAEKQSTGEETIASFADSYLTTRIQNANNQIIYGRRGTGKTHLLNYLHHQWNQAEEVISCYIDVRTLGSTDSVKRSQVNSRQVGTRILRDILSEIHNKLLAYATDPDNDIEDGVLSDLAKLQDLITSLRKLPDAGTEQRTEETEEENTGNLAANAGPGGIEVGGEAGKTTRERHQTVKEEEYDLKESIPFQGVNSLFRDIIERLDIDRCFILIDEWSTLAAVLQPLMSEFLKRSLLAISSVTVKIATIKYRTRFWTQDNGNIGFELGADISADVNLDEFYVYDRNPDYISELFSEVLYNQLSVEYDGDFGEELEIAGPEDLPSRLFTQQNSFEELVRASEGVVRDFLVIFSIGFSKSIQSGQESVGIRQIEDAAQDWYESDKRADLQVDHRDALRFIVRDVIGDKNARTFMVDREKSDHEIIKELYDFRLIHLISRGYSDKENPGTRYDVFTIDYGTYVDYKGTASEPEIDLRELENPEENPDRIVPFDDKRSIRRIILDPEDLEP